MRDAVDEYLGQWAALRDDLDLVAMGTVGRAVRLARHLNAGLEAYFARHGLEVWAFDVLATLRRNDRPLTARELADSMMIGAAALTNRVDHLVQRGWVTRDPAPGNRRAVHIELTDAGRAVVDGTLPGHLDNERNMLSPLSDGEIAGLNDLLRRLLIGLDDTVRRS